MQKKEVLHKIYKSPVQDFFLGLSFSMFLTFPRVFLHYL